MTSYNTEIEFPKIAQAFQKVRYDVSELYEVFEKFSQIQKEQTEIIEKLNKEIYYLKEELNLNTLKNYSKKEDDEIVGNVKSKKFHYNKCPFAKNIKFENKINFENIEEAVKQGYNECSCIREV